MPSPVVVRSESNKPSEVVGADRNFGIWPESISCEADTWGPSKASFVLKRDGRRPWPDLRTYTPIDVEVGGKRVWSGRVSETPNGGSNMSMSVQCEGWQYHLDDDVYEKFYVHDQIGDWKDTRAIPGTPLNLMLPRATVQAGSGAITIGFAKGVEWPSGTSASVTLDLGPATALRAFSAYYGATPGYVSGMYLYFRFSNSPDPSLGGYDALIVPGTISGGAGLGTAPSGYRYLHIFMWNPGATWTPSAGDATVTFRSLTVYADAAWLSGSGTSLLKASDVVNDAVTLGTSKLSSNRARIAATTTNLNAFYINGLRTPREYINQANAYHNYLTQVDAQRRVVFTPRPTRAIYEVGEWSGMSVDDLSANSGGAIYNRVYVEGSDPAGQPVRVLRTTTAANAPTRAGFNRTKILQPGFTLPSDGVLAAAIGDAWLAENHLTPFKGSVKVKQGGVRDIKTGDPVPLENLLGNVGQLMRFTDRAEPDTGGWGRDGRIAAVSWDHGTDEVTISIDNTNTNFEALLSRLAVVANAASARN